MPTKYTVTAVDRSGMGHPNYHTPGRSWPSGQPVEVEVLDQDACPMLSRVIDGETFRYPDPVRIGRNAWKRICADKKLTVRPVGDDTQDVQNFAAQLKIVETDLAAATARADAAELQVKKLQQEGPDWAKKTQAEIKRLEGVVAALKGEVDKANARAKAAEDQLEELTAPNKKGNAKGK